MWTVMWVMCSRLDVGHCVGDVWEIAECGHHVCDMGSRLDVGHGVGKEFGINICGWLCGWCACGQLCW